MGCMPRGLIGRLRRFGKTHYLHLQGRSVDVDSLVSLEDGGSAFLPTYKSARRSIRIQKTNINIFTAVRSQISYRKNSCKYSIHREDISPRVPHTKHKRTGNTVISLLTCWWYGSLHSADNHGMRPSQRHKSPRLEALSISVEQMFYWSYYSLVSVLALHPTRIQFASHARVGYTDLFVLTRPLHTNPWILVRIWK